MTEEEKRKLALSIMAQEQQRLKSSSFRDYQTAEATQAQRRIASNQALFSTLAQNGICWAQLDAAYDTAFAEGERDMLTYHFSFFYAAAALSYHEFFDASPEDTATFIRALPTAPGETRDHKELVEKCIHETGVDTSYADKEAVIPPVTKRDRKAVERMMKTGITQRDLELEKRDGYANGRNSKFFLSACYATVALVLKSLHGWDSEEIEAFLERVSEIQDEEISAADIIERAKEEAGVDVSGIAQTPM